MRVSRLLVTAIVFGLALFVGPAQVAHGATLTVDSTADTSDFSTADGVCDTDDSAGDGPCTLRAAIEQANFDAGTDTIAFNIAGAGPHTIAPASALPAITDPVIIDGTSEPDFVSTPIVELDGSSAGALVDGLNITAGGSTVKGLVINRFEGDGIELATNGGNALQGNYIGTDVDGTVDLGNTRNGVFIDGAPSNSIGGTVAGEGNLISGNDLSGLWIRGLGNSVEGNYIGTNAAGTVAIANGRSGVDIYFGSSNTLGPDNVISGNVDHGVEIGGFSTGNTVSANKIGTNAAGTAAIANNLNGVVISSPSNTIGPGNVISGNDIAGVAIEGGGATGNQVHGNFIGTDVTGTAAIANRFDGVFILLSAPSNTIGPGNVISGNGTDGVRIFGGAGTGNQVHGNFIGTDVTGTAAIANGGDGVSISSASNTVGPDNVISGNGGDGVDIFAPSNKIGPGNVISGNGADGVEISGAAATGNTITENSIYSNGGAGIDNVSGGNTELWPPSVLTVGSASGSSDCASCTIEVFSDDDDEGKIFHGTATTAAGPCPCAWSFGGVVTGPKITATVTDGSGNTSEFSCPNPPTTWPVPVGDDDCDGFTTTIENFVGTDPNDPCADTPIDGDEADDKWPIDFTDNQFVNSFDLIPFIGNLNVVGPAPPYDVRLDLSTDGNINTFDLIPFIGMLNKACLP